MKKIYTIFTIALCAVFGMQAQLSPIVGEFKTIERKQSVKKVESVISKDITTKAVTTKAISADQLAGEYTATGSAALQGREDETWTVTIEKDETDANKVWIQPVLSLAVAGLPDQYINPVYAIINANGTLSLPMGQVVYAETGASFAIAATEDGAVKDLTSSITLTVSADGKSIVFDEKYIYGIGETIANKWWYQALYDIVFTKNSEDPIVNVYEKGNAAPTQVKTSQLFFADVNGEMCVTTNPDYSADKIAGTYSAYAYSAFEGEPDEEWTVKIVRDETDATKVWIQPVLLLTANGLPAELINPVYATYDEAKGTLKLPMGQVLFSQADKYNLVLGCTLDGEMVDTEGYILLTITDGKIVFDQDYIVGVGNTIGDQWWWQALYGIEYTRTEGVAIPLSNIEKISRK